MAEDNNRNQSVSGRNFALPALFIVALFAAQQIYSGVTLKKVGVPGLLEFDFMGQPAIEVSRDFFIGRWQVEQNTGAVSGGTQLNYAGDGRLNGYMTQFVNGVGQKQYVTGNWGVSKINKETFRLDVTLDNGYPWMGTFKVIDQDHIHNVDQNYVAVRLK